MKCETNVISVAYQMISNARKNYSLNFKLMNWSQLYDGILYTGILRKLLWFSRFFFSFVHMYHQCINLKFKIVLYFHCPSLKQEWKTECL